MIKICKKPYIAEDTDRWGQELGTYSVYGSEVGSVEEDFWEELKLFENYQNTPEGEAERKQAGEDIKAGKNIDQLKVPLMTRLLTRSKTMLWEFNMMTGYDGIDSCYVRSYAVFDQPTLREYMPAHDEEVKKLEEKCKEMNA